MKKPLPLRREAGLVSTSCASPGQIRFALLLIFVFGVSTGSVFTALVVAPDVEDHVYPQVKPGTRHSHCHEAAGGFHPRCYADNHCPGGDLCPLDPHDSWLTPYIEAP
jgi:hypothetical protein